MTVADEKEKRTYAVWQHGGRYAGRSNDFAGQKSKAEGSRQDPCLGSKTGDQGLRRLSAAVELHNYLKDVAAVDSVGEKHNEK